MASLPSSPGPCSSEALIAVASGQFRTQKSLLHLSGGTFLFCCRNILPIIMFPRSKTWWRWSVTVLTHLEISLRPWTLSPSSPSWNIWNDCVQQDLELIQALSLCLWISKEEHEDHFRLTNVHKFLMKYFSFTSDFEKLKKRNFSAAACQLFSTVWWKWVMF